MNSQKLNGEGTRNILLNDAVLNYVQIELVNLFHYNRSLE